MPSMIDCILLRLKIGSHGILLTPAGVVSPNTLLVGDSTQNDRIITGFCLSLFLAVVFWSACNIKY